MARTPKSVECIIQAGITHFNKTHKIPKRLLDDCNQEIAVAIMNFLSSNPDMNDSWITMRAYNIADTAGERFLKSEKLHDSRLTHDKDDEVFLYQLECDRIKHRAICKILKESLEEIVSEINFNDREIDMILIILNESNGEFTYKKLGEVFGITSQRACQIYTNICRKFWLSRKSIPLLDYFDML